MTGKLRSNHSNLKSLFAGIIASSLVIVMNFSPLLADERSEMDQILRNELGIDEKKVTEDKKKPADSKNVKEENPIEERYRNANDDSAGSLIWTLVKVLFVFGILTAIMYYVLKIISKKRDSRYPVKAAMKVLGSLPLGTNKELQIVDVSGMLLLLGVSDQSVNLIKEIDSREIKEKIYTERDNFEPVNDNFLDQFVGSLKNLDLKHIHQKPKNNSEFEEDLMDELKLRQKERLSKMKEELDTLGKKQDSNSSKDSL